ncbi:MAG: hypothetical protein KDD33_05920 [Bdellovibrionales bacterium]|nr:hypothetical protein [Bdellovibrionales bacterium]
MKNLAVVFALFFMFAFPPVAEAGIFPFLKCTEGSKEKPGTCKLCLASSTSGANPICSQQYQYENKNGGRSPEIANIAKELTDDFSNKLVEIKELPKPGFKVEEFYKQYTKYDCDQGNSQLDFIDKQIEFLTWKRKQIAASLGQKSCRLPASK